ncbi:hypothetical protein ABWL39_16395 [Chitinivorax sp. PXF-14]|uniref:hypothetical protein n=1 Tax=Chitinivorax sp. PXF-14 TaxID=3230488 RepID=UPI003466C529
MIAAAAGGAIIAFLWVCFSNKIPLKGLMGSPVALNWCEAKNICQFVVFLYCQVGKIA